MFHVCSIVSLISALVKDRNLGQGLQLFEKLFVSMRKEIIPAN